jgi:PPK2 family polyphosphate:nucleotide phosphotransferase
MPIAPRFRADASFRLRHSDPADTSLFEEEEGAVARLSERINELEDVLCAAHDRSVLVVLQGMDGAGKDEIICNVFQRVNPSRLRVAAFGDPSKEEQDHDFLWRVHKRAPARGEIVIFDRSHYEGVLVERVHDIVPRPVWQRRFEQIRVFEETLADHGAVILKFFLHLSKEEQKRRIDERLADPKKSWKFDESDLRERKLWPRYMRAYEDAVTRTTTKTAPWFVIPSDHRWYRDRVVAEIVVEAMEALRLRYPRKKRE